MPRAPRAPRAPLPRPSRSLLTAATGGPAAERLRQADHKWQLAIDTLTRKGEATDQTSGIRPTAALLLQIDTDQFSQGIRITFVCPDLSVNKAAEDAARNALRLHLPKSDVEPSLLEEEPSRRRSTFDRLHTVEDRPTGPAEEEHVAGRESHLAVCLPTR
jgi:hypothetical protein